MRKLQFTFRVSSFRGGTWPGAAFFLSFALAAILPAGPAGAQSIHSFNSGMNCNGVWNFPDTGQTASYTATFGEDHDYRPQATQPAYTILNPVGISSVTVDNITGLMWITNPATDAGFNKGGPSTWAVAISSCEALNYAGYTDWRLPNILELAGIVNYGLASAPVVNTTAFPGVAGSFLYWTSTTYVATPTNAWHVNFGDGSLSGVLKSNGFNVNVLCVRGGL